MSQHEPPSETLPDSRAEALTDRERELIGLVKLDYDAALRTMSGFIASGSQLRGIGLAAWGVVVGLAVNADSAVLAGLAFALTLVFAYADSYHAALYRRGLTRAIAIEGLLDNYLDRLGIDFDDEDAVERTLAKLETHRFGMHRTLRPVKIPRDLFVARPRVVFWLIYPALAATALAVLLVYAL